MLLRTFLAKLDSKWDRDKGLKVDIINRLSRLGYTLVDPVKVADEAVITDIVKRASAKWQSERQVADTMHVAYPTATPVAVPTERPRCPNCNNLMRIALLGDGLETHYCTACRICKLVEA